MLSNKNLFRVHSWLGLHSGFLLLVVCLSGTLATLSYEIDWLLDPAIRNAATADHTAEASYQQIYTAVKNHYPQARVLALSKPAAQYLPFVVVIVDSNRGTHLVSVDRYSGRVLNTRNLLTVKTFMRIFHKQFFMVSSPYSFHGLYIVGTFGLFLLLSALSGLLLLGSWLKHLTRLRWHKGLRVLLVDWHRSTGLWAFLLALIFALTGIWYWIEKIADITDFTVDHGADLITDNHFLPEPNLDAYTAAAQRALPGLAIRSIRLASKPEGVVVISGEHDAWLVRDVANLVVLNPYTADVIDAQPGTELGLYQRWVHTADPLHFGDFAGLWSKGVWFTGGLLISIGIGVGLAVALLRLKATNRHRPSRKMLMLANLLTLILLIITTVFSVVGINRMQTPPHYSHSVNYGLQTVGPWRVALQHFFSANNSSGQLALQFEAARPNLKSATLVLQGPSEKQTLVFAQRWHEFTVKPAPGSLQQQQLQEQQLQEQERPPQQQLLQQQLQQWHRDWPTLTLRLESHHGQVFSHNLSRAAINTAISHLQPTASALPNHRPTQLFIGGFLLSVWGLFFVWVYIQWRLLGQHNPPPLAGQHATKNAIKISPIKTGR